jgi:hypothetical protein
VDMAETPEDVEVIFADGGPESLEVSAIGTNLYRVALTPFNDPDDCSLAYGDVFEAERIGVHKLRFIRTVDRARMRQYSVVLSDRVIEAEEFAAYCQEVIREGGMWERLFGGLLIVHIPADSEFDPERELDRVIERIRLREAP